MVRTMFFYWLRAWSFLNYNYQFAAWWRCLKCIVDLEDGVWYMYCGTTCSRAVEIGRDWTLKSIVLCLQAQHFLVYMWIYISQYMSPRTYLVELHAYHQILQYHLWNFHPSVRFNWDPVTHKIVSGQTSPVYTILEWPWLCIAQFQQK